MAEQTILTSANGLGVISTANSNLDGSGSITKILTAQQDGTFLKSIYIKAQESTSNGMVRLFIDDGSNYTLLTEVRIKPVTRGAYSKSFGKRIVLRIPLEKGFTIAASTENAEIFNIVAEAVHWTYDTVVPESTKYTAVTGLGTVDTANTSLDGTGAMSQIYTVTNRFGSIIKGYTVKAIVDTSPGMIRIFLRDPFGTTVLIEEIIVPAVSRSGKAEAFNAYVSLPTGFDLESGYSIWASTENSQTFKIFVDALSRDY